MSRPIAVVTGVSGQDGSLAAELLLGRGYRVLGLGRTSPTVLDGVEFIHGDVADAGRVEEILKVHRPDEFYNFAALTSGAGMFDSPSRMGEVNGLAVTHILEAIRQFSPHTRFCQASSSEMFGDVSSSPQSETTPLRPRSPYGAAKVYAHSMIRIYRERYELFACSAILYNHESARRRIEFVTRKITDGAARIKLGVAKELELGNLDARRDWGSAVDYVRAMHMMLAHKYPDDYVVATGVLHSVRDVCTVAFGHLGLDYREYVREVVDRSRAPESIPLVGDAARLRGLGWQPQVSFEAMIVSMVDADVVEHMKSLN